MLRHRWPVKDQIELIRRTRSATTVLSDIVADRIDWRPLPGPQTEAYFSEADELAYGGAAGGGKSDLLLGLALTAHRNSIIFRREGSQLKGADGIVARSEAMIGDAGRLNRSGAGLWRDLPGGRSLEFGSMPHEQNKNRYKGRPHDLKAFDEATEFTQSQYRFAIAWTRTTIPGQRCRVVLTFNPPTSPEGEWVIEEFAPWLDDNYPDPAAPGELRWYCYVGEKLRWFRGLGANGEGNPGPVEIDGETYELKSRTFIPARLEDNPYLMASDYGRTLSALPEPLRSQLRYGSFDVQAEDNPWQVIPTAWIRAAQERWKRLHLDPHFKPSVPLTALGADVARGGKAETVLAPRYGDYVAALECYPGKDTPDGPAVATLILGALGSTGASAILDVLAVGTAVQDALDANSVPYVAFNASEASQKTDRSGLLKMLNKRAEAWWRMRELLDPANGYEVALPDDRMLRADLSAPRFKLTVRGIQIEAKEDVAKRIGRSTDRGDAVVMAFEDVVDRSWVMR